MSCAFVIFLFSFLAAVFPIENASVDQNATRNTFLQNSTLDRNNNTNHGLVYPREWLADLFYQSLVTFSVKDVGSSACKQQTQMYLSHLKNNSRWAVKMSDSWVKYPNGLLIGLTHHIGVYDECINVHQPVQGKYCMSNIQLHPVTTGTKKFSQKPGNNDPAWEEILGFNDVGDQVRRNHVNIGICIPEACTFEDLEFALQRKLDSIFLAQNVNATVKVEPSLCSTNKDVHPFGMGYHLTRIILGLIFLICCLSTIVHLIILKKLKDNKETSTFVTYIKWFSIIQNMSDLLKYEKKNPLDAFYGAKLLFMAIVLCTHKYLYIVWGPLQYPPQVEDALMNKSPSLFDNVFQNLMYTSSNGVDPFFFFNAYLTYFSLKSHYNKRKSGWSEVPRNILYKYLRMVPAYAAVILVTIYVVPHIRSGPFWSYKIQPEIDRCKHYGWTNLLFINNFIGYDKQCLLHSWYISCLLQFHVIGAVVSYVYYKSKRRGLILMWLMLIISLITPFVLTFYKRTIGFVKLNYSNLEDVFNDSTEFKDLYRPFYTRMTPYAAGLLASVLVDNINERKIQFSMTTSYAGTGVTMIVCYFIQAYAVLFYDSTRPYNPIEHALYASLSHCTYTILFFVVAVFHSSWGYGYLENVFSNRITVFFGKMLYSVYLVNIVVIMSMDYSRRSAVYLGEEQLYKEFVYNAVACYFVAIFLYLTVEAPFGSIIKKIFYG
ncbi:nose resistant to fluoxetine protein 6-like isoform X1 [Adelges cooleyi]|uniref:nose resistant to fluoxetine protein 6-like isoform X1 n=1 Tax=Adelges cooleyi TaxID=133065 RepID=UPI0021803F6C|nr:nose resistant to fluoxetine protein 6-like isoform X1 [Adelges cooleyi]